MGAYAYSPYLWPAFISTLLVASLGWYGWRHRWIAGALPFAVAAAFAVAWSVGSMLQTAAVHPDTKIFWLRFLTVWQLPVVTAGTGFVLQFAGLGRWLTRRVIILLAIPPLLLAGFILTNDLHHLMWTGFVQIDDGVTPLRGPVNTGALVYSYLLGLFNVSVLLWLLVRFPRYRWPALLLIVAHLGARFVFEFGLRLGFPSHWDYGPFVLLFTFGMYAIALFRFHVFDPVPVARAAAIDHMREAMIVLDVQGLIVDANPAAQRTLGESISRLRRRAVGELLPEGGLAVDTTFGKVPARSELSLGEGARQRHYTLEATLLKDRRDRDLGTMLLFQDVTEQKTAQALLLEQERVVAVLEERERLAREIHDGLGQVFGFMSMQAQTVRSRLRAGDGEKADTLLARLVEVAQEAHEDVRASISDLKTASAKEWSFVPTLERYLEGFRLDHGISTELAVGPDIDETTLEATVAVQLFRVVQEALTNARRHGAATSVCVSIEREDSVARIMVEDNGSGFDPGSGLDPGHLRTGESGHFGLTFMRERMAQVGGHVEIDSQPGAGTRIILTAPLAAGAPREGDGGESTTG
jgi:PAS domain S-box-containing protein